MTTTDVPQVPVGRAINQALDEAMAADPRVILLGEDISDVAGGGVFKITAGLSSKYGVHRVRDTPISEQAIVGAAIGAALGGLRPVAEIMIMDFITVAMDQLCNHAAKLRYMSGGQTNVPLTIRCSGGAGLQFGAQHSEMLEAWLVHIPGLKVVVPSNAADAKGLLVSCIDDDDPCVFVEQTTLYRARGPLPDGDHRVPLGSAAVAREGSEVTLISYGREVNTCLAAAAELAEEGVKAEVVDLRSLVPLDEATVLASVAKTTRAVVVHQAVRRGGVGAEVAAMIQEELFGELAAPVLRVTAPNTPVPYAVELERAFVPGTAQVVEAVRRSVKQ